MRFDNIQRFLNRRISSDATDIKVGRVAAVLMMLLSLVLLTIVGLAISSEWNNLLTVSALFDIIIDTVWIWGPIATIGCFGAWGYLKMGKEMQDQDTPV